MTRRRTRHPDPLRDFDAFDPALPRQHGRERGITAAKFVALFGGGGGGGGNPTTGLLLEDGSSFFMLEDGSSFFLLES